MSAVAGQRSEYTPTEVETGLRVLATLGNSTRASEVTGIKADTLNKWRSRNHRERYLEILHEEAPRLEQVVADQTLELVMRGVQIEHGIYDRLDNPDLGTKEVAELAGAAQRVATAKGINTTKRLELLGRPTQIVQHLSPQEAIRGLARDLGITFDGEATEIPTNELPAASSTS